MRPSKVLYIGAIFLTLSVFQFCVEPFDLEVPGGSTFLVVDGVITDQPGPYTIELSLTIDFSNTEFSPFTGAQVAIQEQDGVTETLTENAPGVYQTNMIQGKAGKQYKLVIQTEQDQYESSWETLKASPPIDSVYWRIENRSTVDQELRGIQLYVDGHDEEGSTRFYRYEWKETWFYTVPFATGLEYIGNRETINVEPKRNCWITVPSNQLSVASSEANAIDVISGHPLIFVSTLTNRLQHRYSLEVEQFAISENEYRFLAGLQETSGESGDLFDRQPQSLRSNVVNLSNPAEPVLGQFSASGISSQRIYVDDEQLPSDLTVQSFADSCELVKIPFTDPFAEERVATALNSGSLFYEYFGFVAPEGFSLTTAECVDCRLFGGSLEKPSFWVD